MFGRTFPAGPRLAAPLATILAILASAAVCPAQAPPDTLDQPVLERRVATRVTALGGSQVAVKLERPVQSGEAIQLFTRQVDTLKSEAQRVRHSADGTASLQLDRGTTYVLRTEAFSRDPVALTSDKHFLPDRLLYTPTPQEHPGPDPPVRSFGLFLTLKEAPVPWSDAADAYRTELLAGLLEIAPDGSLASGAPPMPTLDPPLTVRFTGRQSTFDPETLEITRAGTAGIQTTELTIPRGVEGAGVTAITDLGTAELTYDVAMSQIRLFLGAEQTTINGWGMGVTSLTVTREQSDGTPMTQGELEIWFTRSGDEPLDAPESIEDGRSTARARLRSRGTGTTEVVAGSSSAIVSNPVTITYKEPWLLVVLTVVGSLVGGGAAWWQEKPRRRKAQVGPPGLVRRLVLGLVTGVVAVGAITLGLWKVELLDLARTELGAFILSLLAGWAGPALIDTILGGIGFRERAADGK